MALLKSNFTSNSLSGNVIVSGGLANINLGAINYTALEGTKTYYVKLRKYSNTGSILAVSNAIVIPDRTGITSLVSNVSTIPETGANIVSYTITTANVLGNITLNWSTTGTANDDDFIANTGTVIVSNNIGTFTTQLASDFSGASETGEYYGIRLSPISGGQSGNVIYATTLANAVTILDTSYAPIFNYITPNVFYTFDSSIVSFNIATTNAGNTRLYYSTTGSLSNSEIVTANTGSFTPTSDSNVSTITIRIGSVATDPTAPRNFKLQIRTQSPVGNIIFTGSNVYVYAPGIVATGGTITTLGNYNIHTFYTGATFAVTSGSGNIETLLIAGGGSGGTGASNGMSAFMTGGGGGAGGVVYKSAVPVTPGNYPAVVGGGGVAVSSTGNPGFDGTPTTFAGLTALGGGGGGQQGWPNLGVPSYGRAGGSGGGGGGQQTGVNVPGGTATQPTQPNPGALQYGNSGGSSYGPGIGVNAGGGGGAGSAGVASFPPGSPTPAPGGPTAGFGGDGIINPIVGSTVGVLFNGSYYIGGGGGGGRDNNTPIGGLGGLGGGGAGGGTVNPSSAGWTANAFTGGGGGGGVYTTVPTGAGGGGVVIVKYLAGVTFPSQYIP
jgi:hypothetical protein